MGGTNKSHTSIKGLRRYSRVTEHRDPWETEKLGGPTSLKSNGKDQGRT